MSNDDNMKSEAKTKTAGFHTTLPVHQLRADIVFNLDYFVLGLNNDICYPVFVMHGKDFLIRHFSVEERDKIQIIIWVLTYSSPRTGRCIL